MIVIYVYGVIQTAQLYPMNFVTQIDRVERTVASENPLVQAVEKTNTKGALTVSAQDMAMRLSSESAMDIVKSMAAFTGIGQHIDLRV